MPAVDSGGPRPPYLQIADDMRRRIMEGEWGNDGRLPSSRELMSTFGVASMTVHQAIKVLRDEGRVTSQPGRGVYVRPEGLATVPAGEGTPGDGLVVQLAEIKERVQILEESPDVVALRRDVQEIRQQVASLEANLIDLYGKVGQSYPHGQSARGRHTGSEAPRRQVGNA